MNPKLTLSKETPVIVQGITGHQGRIHTAAMKQFGTNIVAGVSPGKAGALDDGTPILDTVHECMAEFGAEASVIFVPAIHAKEAAYEAIEAGIRTIVMVTEHVPPQDTVRIAYYARSMGVTIIGPNSPGIAIPGTIKLGIMPNSIFMAGPVGVISRSGTLTYEVVQSLTDAGIGQTLCIGIGGDAVTGTSMVDALRMCEGRDDIKGIVLIGEIGGAAEEMAAEYIQENASVPVVSFVAGMTAPAGKRMGHAGAIISRGTGLAEDKVRRLSEAGVDVATRISVIPKLISTAMKTTK
ncbi:MAG TPA: succinate--CoA ligase subunit alpha [Methanomassiliicoccales archaeon]|jgi:succinyl-CoA synthetase alpha subunit